MKTFAFTKKGVNLDKHPETNCTRIRVGTGQDSLVFTMKNYQDIHGHDDSLPYQADLYCNNKLLCKCFNDGWGSCTELTIDEKCDKTKSIDEVINYIKNYTWEYQGHKFNLELEFIADTLACGLTKEEY